MATWEPCSPDSILVGWILCLEERGTNGPRLSMHDVLKSSFIVN